ncbi:hypothetical protein NKI98_18050 [Mesorhizobium sp. M0222]|uniref:hypothetical protein n=1 Tax=Mesorhizobium sp. M0222 TaxID=2956921 RepID=UPI003336D7FD
MPNEFIPFATDGHEEGDPPTQEEIAFDGQVDSIGFGLWKSTLLHVNIAFELPLTLESIRKFKPVYQLDAKRRDQLVLDAADAMASAARRLPPNYSRGQIVTSMSAAITVIRSWAEDDVEKAAHHPHRLTDAKVWIKLFERDLRNLSDFQWLQQRKAQRREEIVASMLIGSSMVPALAGAA